MEIKKETITINYLNRGQFPIWEVLQNWFSQHKYPDCAIDSIHVTENNITREWNIEIYYFE